MPKCFFFFGILHLHFTWLERDKYLLYKEDTDCHIKAVGRTDQVAAVQTVLREGCLCNRTHYVTKLGLHNVSTHLMALLPLFLPSGIF